MKQIEALQAQVAPITEQIQRNNTERRALEQMMERRTRTQEPLALVA